MIEKKLRERDLLPILKMNDGSPVTAENWQERRAEMKELLEKYSYGRMPKRPYYVEEDIIEHRENAYSGKATYQKIQVAPRTERGHFFFPMQIVIPNKVKNPPVFLHMTFSDDLPDRLTPVEEIIDAGYAVATIFKLDIVNDNMNGDFSDGLAKHFGVTKDRKPDEWGKIGMWAYAASCALDYLFTRDDVDAARTTVIGLSRMGKVALWAGACDERFWCTISTCSGYGGAATSKYTIAEPTRNFLYWGSWDWMCENFKEFVDEKENQKPYDQAFMLAMVAPRYLCVSSGEDDVSSDPESEFLATAWASQAWELLGRKGLVTDGKMPKGGDCFMEGNVEYHMRKGGHTLSRTDWQKYIQFLDKKREEEGVLPAKEPEKKAACNAADRIEDKLKERDLLPILKMQDGTAVTAENWPERRAEMKELLEYYSYGRMAPKPDFVEGTVEKINKHLMPGKAVVQDVQVCFRTDKGHAFFPIKMYVPLGKEKPPVFLLLSFDKKVPNRYAPVEEIIDAGYALAVIYYKDIVNDNMNADFSDGFGTYFGVTKERKPDEWGKIGMWAYAASCVLDYLLTREDLDGKRTTVIGHSRLGKTALWAGACDERFWCTISNCSGYGGAATSKFGKGERVRDFLYWGSWDWMCEKFKEYVDEKENEKPYDQAFLLAMIAPRYLCVGSAIEDHSADPESEFLTTAWASQAWEVQGKKGLVTGENMPKIGDCFMEGSVEYHVRPGTHFLSRDDWKYYIDFLNKKIEEEKNEF